MKTTNKQRAYWLARGITGRTAGGLIDNGITDMDELVAACRNNVGDITTGALLALPRLGHQAIEEITPMLNDYVASAQSGEGELGQPDLPDSIEVVKDGQVTQTIDFTENDRIAPQFASEKSPLEIEIDQAPGGVEPRTGTEFPLGPKYEGMSLGERIEAVRLARGYVQRSDTPSGTPFSKAVKFAEVMKGYRPLAIEWGVRWQPSGSHVLHNERYQGVNRDGTPGKIWFYALIRWDFLFFRTEVGPSDEQRERIEVVTEALDFQDKGCSKSLTNAEKLCILRTFNTEYGDDPDFTPIGAPDLPTDVEDVLIKIRECLASDHQVSDVDSQLTAIAHEWGKLYNRRVANIYAIPLGGLQQILAKLQKIAAQPTAGPAPQKKEPVPELCPPADPAAVRGRGNVPVPPTPAVPVVVKHTVPLPPQEPTAEVSKTGETYGQRMQREAEEMKAAPQPQSPPPASEPEAPKAPPGQQKPAPAPAAQPKPPPVPGAGPLYDPEQARMEAAVADQPDLAKTGAPPVGDEIPF